jgi:Flp pilus assembly protein CpaB
MFWTWLACGTAVAPPEQVTVVVAARELHVGVPIGEQDIYGSLMPANAAPDDAFVDPDAVLGRVPASTIYPNEPIRAARLADATMQAALAAMVPPELTVVTIPLDPAVGVTPDPKRDKVDVWRDADLLGGKGERVAEALPILRIDDRIVAVMATDAQVELIAAARTAGKVTVAPPIAPPPIAPAP